MYDTLDSEGCHPESDTNLGSMKIDNLRLLVILYTKVHFMMQKKSADMNDMRGINNEGRTNECVRCRLAQVSLVVSCCLESY